MLILRVRAVRVRPAMTRPQYAPVPRGYVRVWVVTVPGHRRFAWTYQTEKRARTMAEVCSGTITPLDVPAGAIPGLAATRRKR